MKKNILILYLAIIIPLSTSFNNLDLKGINFNNLCININSLFTEYGARLCQDQFFKSLR